MCTENSKSKGELTTTCCANVNTLLGKNMTATQQNFTVSAVQLFDATSACVANTTDTTNGTTCSVKKITAAAGGLRWYWWVLIVLLCLCVCGACGLGGWRETQKNKNGITDH